MALKLHEIAEPCRSEDLGFLTGSGGLLLLRFLDSRLDDVGVLQKQFFIDLLLVRETVAKFLVGIRRPYDVLFSPTYLQVADPEGMPRDRFQYLLAFPLEKRPSFAFHILIHIMAP